MGVKLYGSAMSTCTARVSLILEEMGVDYDLVGINFSTGEHKKPPHTTRNPFGQVPAFEDGDLTLFESRAIARYIVRKFKGSGGPDLLGESSLEKSALVDVWTEVESQHFNSAIQPIIYQSLVVPRLGGLPDEGVITASSEKLAKVLDVYEDRLSKSRYLAGDFFSLADALHVPHVFYLLATPSASLFNTRPYFRAWWEDVMARPAVKKVTDAMVAATAK